MIHIIRINSVFIKRIDSWPRIDTVAWKLLKRINSWFLGDGIYPALVLATGVPIYGVVPQIYSATPHIDSSGFGEREATDERFPGCSLHFEGAWPMWRKVAPSVGQSSLRPGWQFKRKHVASVLAWKMARDSILIVWHELFISAGNLKPKTKCFFNPKLKPFLPST